MNLTATPITRPITFHGEGPFWDSDRGQLLCVDLLAGAVVAVGPSGQFSRYPVPSRVATVVRRRSCGGYVIATEGSVLGADDALSRFEVIAELNVSPDVRTNDGGCDPSGDFIIGTMAYDERDDGGAVYRISPGGVVDKILSPVSISNGVQWSADKSRVFYIDTPTRCVDVFDVDAASGRWSGRRTHLRIHGATGYPDGMAIDEEDGLWIAIWGGNAIHHYDANGSLVESIGVPGVSQPSSCAFGGDQRDVLYITTSRQGLPEGAEPLAGAVFALQVRVKGAQVWEFRG